MAKQVLPVNFKDDILSPSMGGKRRYNLIQNDDGTYSLEDVTEYTQTGSDFGAGQINATNQAVNESCDKANVIETMDDIVANQADGMIAGAKAVAELNGNLYYESGDTVSLAKLFVDGVITSDNKELHYTIPLPKKLDHVSSARITGSAGKLRQNGNYLMTSDATTDHTFGQSQYSITLLKDLQALHVVYTYTGDSIGTNNDVFSLEFASGTIQFS